MLIADCSNMLLLCCYMVLHKMKGLIPINFYAYHLCSNFNGEWYAVYKLCGLWRCEATPRTVQSNFWNHLVFEHERNTSFSFEAVAVCNPIGITCVNRVGGG